MQIKSVSEKNSRTLFILCDGLGQDDLNHRLRQLGGQTEHRGWKKQTQRLNKKAFQYDAYRPRRKAEQWTSSHEANCGQTDICENITFPLRSVTRKHSNMMHTIRLPTVSHCPGRVIMVWFGAKALEGEGLWSWWVKVKWGGVWSQWGMALEEGMVPAGTAWAIHPEG